jgi:hypothetical protein
MTIYDNGNRNGNDTSNNEQPLTMKNAYLYFHASIPMATCIVIVYDNMTTIYQQRATTSNTATATVANNESDV